MLLALTVILALGGLIGTQLAALADEVPRYTLTIEQKIDTLQQFMASRITDLTSTLSHKPSPAGATMKARPGHKRVPESHPPTRKSRSRSRCTSPT